MKKVENTVPLVLESFESPESSNILGAEYNSSIATLIITFKGGRKYLYEKVGVVLWEQFKSSESKGKFFASQIKPAYPGKLL